MTGTADPPDFLDSGSYDVDASLVNRFIAWVVGTFVIVLAVLIGAALAFRGRNEAARAAGREEVQRPEVV